MSDFNTEHNTVVWFDLAVADLDRADAFHRGVLDCEVTQPVHSLGPHGFRALVRDSEGNRLALHAESDT